MPATKKDYLLVSVIGFLFGLLVLPILQNLKISVWHLTIVNALAVIIGFTFLSVLALWAAGLIAKKIPVILQFAKFGAVGALGTVLDFGILNMLIFLTTISSGGFYVVFKGVSFLAANINSYFWNKYWAFKKEAPPGAPALSAQAKSQAAAKEYLQFLVVSVVGFMLNVGVASLIVNVWGVQWGVDVKLWANIGAFGGTLVGLAWNFLGYKLIVFKD